jgi:hypothetical protein
MAGSNRVRQVVRSVALAVVLVVVAGCTGPVHAAHPSNSAVVPLPAAVTESVAHGRFTVVLGSKALAQATAAGFSLPALVTRALEHIDALLPGPHTTVAVNMAAPADLITQQGSNGITDPTNGHITIAFGPTPQASVRQALTLWLQRAMSHEVDHSVRILAGPGFGPTLIQEIITEGISSVFDETAFPGLPNPWDRAVSPTQECVQWKKAQSFLGDTDSYALWLVGGDDGVPHWTGFTIGYHIVSEYRASHPGVSWSALTAANARTILAGSHYQPCPN